MDTICFTGRRPQDLCGYDYKSKYEDLQKWLTGYLEEFYEKGVRNFISGGAQGFDQLAFWAVEDLKKNHPDVKNIVYVPFQGQESRWKPAGLYSRAEYYDMIDKSDETYYLYSVDGKNTGQVINAMHNRNHDMVNAADAVIALFPFDDWEGKSGTWECMSYAMCNGKSVYQIKYDLTEKGVEVTGVKERLTDKPVVKTLPLRFQKHLGKDDRAIRLFEKDPHHIDGVKPVTTRTIKRAKVSRDRCDD